MKKTLVLLFLLVIGCCCGCSVGNVLNQGIQTIELGEDSSPLDYVEFPTDKYSVKVVDDGGFNVNAVGTYTITYRITKLSNNRSADKSFSFTVEDTTAPNIVSIETDIYVARGNTFDISDFVEYTDKSGMCEIKTEGTVDIDTAGKYEIQASVTDKSGNKTISEPINVIVENRDKTDFRNAKFGDTRDEIERYETANQTLASEELLAFEDYIGGIESRIIYSLNKNGQLYSIGCLSESVHTGGDAYLSDFEKYKECLTGIFGKATSDYESKGSLYGYCDSKGEALTLEEYARQAKWTLEEYSIVLTVKSDNYKIVLGFVITSNIIQH